MDHALIRVRLQPRSSREAIVGWREDVLIARVSAPPVDGRANAALSKLLARELGVAPSRVEVVRGERSRDKTVRIEGMEAAAVAAALGGPV